jgi:ribose-phosphate pyrophosphokinase
MDPVVIALRGSEPAGAKIAAELGAGAPRPQGYASRRSEVEGRAAVVVGPVPSAGAIGAAARDAGAAVVGLVSPDARGVDAGAVRARFDWLVNVHDPRGPIAGATVSVVADMASWVIACVDNPLVVGERPWLVELAAALEAPPPIAAPAAARLRGHTPLVVGDQLDAGHLQIVRKLPFDPARPPLCIGVHAAIDRATHRAILAAGARGAISCDTIEHPSNAIGMMPRVAGAVRNLLTVA